MQQVDTRLVTPEAVVLQFESAGIGSRFLARFLDLVIQLLLIFVLSVATIVIWARLMREEA